MEGRRGLGGIYLRGGQWWVRYSCRGRKVRESAKSGNRADAVRLLKKRLGEIGRGRLVGPDPEKVTLKTLKTGLLDDYSINGRKSTERATSAIGHVVDYFGENCRALDVTADQINAYVKHRREKKAAAATIKNELAIFRRALNLAVRAELLPHRPAFPVIKVSNARQGFFEEPEFRTVLAHLSGEVGAVAEFMYLTGWRKGEVLSLQWRQVDFTAGVVRLEPGTTKNDEGRTFPFKAFPALEALLKARKTQTEAVEQDQGAIVPWVFHRDGKPVRDFRGVWDSACIKAGLAKHIKDAEGQVVKVTVTRIPHDFRRTAVRNLERAGVPRSVAMKLTGHKTEAVYRRYAIVSEADLSEGVGKLAKLHETMPAKPSKVTPFPATGTEGAQNRG
jgi:integrase